MEIDEKAWSDPWVSSDTCMRHQSAQAEKDLTAWLTGQQHVAFDAFRKLLAPIEFADFLETGCGCGYYRDVLKSFKPQTEYMGIDISEDMIDYADQRFEGNGHFIVGSAEQLPFVGQHFDVVCLAAVLQHLPDWQVAIREAVRVSRRWVMLHRVEAVAGPTFVYENAAYETKLPTRIMNEAELVDFCLACGLRLIDSTYWGRGPGRWNCSLLLDKTG